MEGPCIMNINDDDLWRADFFILRPSRPLRWKKMKLIVFFKGDVHLHDRNVNKLNHKENVKRHGGAGDVTGKKTRPQLQPATSASFIRCIREPGMK